MNREEYLEFCKTRALVYVERGDLKNAVASMGMDLQRREEWQNDFTNVMLFLGIDLVTRADMEGVRRWINGFN